MNLNSEIMKMILAAVKAVLHTICCVLAVFGILMIARNLVNTAFLSSYERGSYLTVPEHTVLYFRFGENYVVPYNLGNAAYQQEDYDKAISYYLQALQNNPPEQDEECRIRVNLALSLCHTIDFDHLNLSDQDAVMEAVSVLLQARYVLTEHGCASEPVGSNDGHFENADRLKHDIDEMLKKLQPPSPSGEGGQNSSGQDSDGDQGEEDAQNQDEEQEDEQDQNGAQNQEDDMTRSGSSQEQEKEELQRQENLKEQLDQQKEDLKNANHTSSYDYEYIDGGDAQGYGDGTLW